jgi:hypothetical protein
MSDYVPPAAEHTVLVDTVLEYVKISNDTPEVFRLREQVAVAARALVDAIHEGPVKRQPRVWPPFSTRALGEMTEKAGRLQRRIRELELLETEAAGEALVQQGKIEALSREVVTLTKQGIDQFDRGRAYEKHATFLGRHPKAYLILHEGDPVYPISLDLGWAQRMGAKLSGLMDTEWRQVHDGTAFPETWECEGRLSPSSDMETARTMIRVMPFATLTEEGPEAAAETVFVLPSHCV